MQRSIWLLVAAMVLAVGLLSGALNERTRPPGLVVTVTGLVPILARVYDGVHSRPERVSTVDGACLYRSGSPPQPRLSLAGLAIRGLARYGARTGRSRRGMSDCSLRPIGSTRRLETVARRASFLGRTSARPGRSGVAISPTRQREPRRAGQLRPGTPVAVHRLGLSIPCWSPPGGRSARRRSRKSAAGTEGRTKDPLALSPTHLPLGGSWTML